jgi:2-amino-4-hydroxy-6-hydroxymethyldihydropteridine diphosphokinase
MTRAFVAFGSNIDAERNVRSAVRLLAARSSLLALSTFYRTAPAGGATGAPFVNGVAEIETELPPLELKRSLLRGIERELGRVRVADKNAARTIDLDLVHYDDLVVASAELALPAPEIAERWFVAAPLAELAPKLRLAGSGVPIRDLAARLGRNQSEALPALTAELRRIARE